MVQFRVEEVPEGPDGNHIPLEALPTITITTENGLDQPYVKAKTEDQNEEEEEGLWV